MIEEIVAEIRNVIESSEKALETYRKQAEMFGESELYRANAHAKVYNIHKMNELIKFINGFEKAE